MTSPPADRHIYNLKKQQSWEMLLIHLYMVTSVDDIRRCCFLFPVQPSNVWRARWTASPDLRTGRYPAWRRWPGHATVERWRETGEMPTTLLYLIPYALLF